MIGGKDTGELIAESISAEDYDTQYAVQHYE